MAVDPGTAASLANAAGSFFGLFGGGPSRKTAGATYDVRGALYAEGAKDASTAQAKRLGQAVAAEVQRFAKSIGPLTPTKQRFNVRTWDNASTFGGSPFTLRNYRGQDIDAGSFNDAVQRFATTIIRGGGVIDTSPDQKWANRIAGAQAETVDDLIAVVSGRPKSPTPSTPRAAARQAAAPKISAPTSGAFTLATPTIRTAAPVTFQGGAVVDDTPPPSSPLPLLLAAGASYLLMG